MPTIRVLLEMRDNLYIALRGGTNDKSRSCIAEWHSATRTQRGMMRHIKESLFNLYVLLSKGRDWPEINDMLAACGSKSPSEDIDVVREFLMENVTMPRLVGLMGGRNWRHIGQPRLQIPSLARAPTPAPIKAPPPQQQQQHPTLNASDLLAHEPSLALGLGYEPASDDGAQGEQQPKTPGKDEKGKGKMKKTKGKGLSRKTHEWDIEDYIELEERQREGNNTLIIHEGEERRRSLTNENQYLYSESDSELGDEE